jgi:hypothetical protein
MPMFSLLLSPIAFDLNRVFPADKSRLSMLLARLSGRNSRVPSDEDDFGGAQNTICTPPSRPTLEHVLNRDFGFPIDRVTRVSRRVMSLGNGIGIRRNLKPLQLRSQPFSADPENLGGASAVSSCVLQYREDQLVLHLVQRHWDD